MLAPFGLPLGNREGRTIDQKETPRRSMRGGGKRRLGRWVRDGRSRERRHGDGDSGGSARRVY